MEWRGALVHKSNKHQQENLSRFTYNTKSNIKMDPRQKNTEGRRKECSATCGESYSGLHPSLRSGWTRRWDHSDRARHWGWWGTQTYPGLCRKRITQYVRRWRELLTKTLCNWMIKEHLSNLRRLAGNMMSVSCISHRFYVFTRLHFLSSLRRLESHDSLFTTSVTDATFAWRINFTVILNLSFAIHRPNALQSNS